MSKTKQTNRKPLASVGAQALNRTSKLIRDNKVVAEVPAEVPAEDKSVAISGVTLVEDRAKDFVSKWSEQTIADIEAGWIADEKRRRNALELMYDYSNDYGVFSDNADEAAKGREALLALPAPYTEAPKGMTPHKWQQDRNNKPWPFDKWSERVSQSQGGKRNVNYSFYLISFDNSPDGQKIGATIASLKDMIANYGKAPLTGDYQSWEKDQLQTELSKYEGRRSTAGENIRKAIGLFRQFAAFEAYATKLTSQGKGPWKYPTFSVAVVTDAEGNQEPASSKKPIRFGIVELTRDANGKEREAVTYKPPISVDTFLNYDADLFAAAAAVAGADVYNAVVESAQVDQDKEVKAIPLPFKADTWIAAAGLFAGFIEQDENRATVIKKLTKKDSHQKYENEAAIRSVVDMYLELVPVYQTLRKVYETLQLSDIEQAKLQRVTNE